MLKVIDSKCLREWWGKERIKLVVKRKEMCVFGSKVFPLWQGWERAALFFLLLLLLSNIHQFMRIGWVLLYKSLKFKNALLSNYLFVFWMLPSFLWYFVTLEVRQELVNKREFVIGAVVLERTCV